MIAALVLAVAAAASAPAPAADDTKCKVERPPVSKPKVVTPLQRAIRPAAPAASAPKAKPKPKAKRKAKPEPDEYEPCPPIRPPSLFSLIPPPDEPVSPPFVAMLPPEGLYAPPPEPLLPRACGCFAGDEGGPGAYPGLGGGGGYGGVGGGGGFVPSPPGPIPPVPEPSTWVMLFAGVAVLAYRRRPAILKGN